MPDYIEEQGGSGVKMKIPCHPRPITARHLISSPDHLPKALYAQASENDVLTMACCIAVVSLLPLGLRHESAEEGAEQEEDDTAIIVFPSENNGQLVRALITGEGTGSCPSGQCKFMPQRNFCRLIFNRKISCTFSPPSFPLRLLPRTYYGRISPDYPPKHCLRRTTFRTVSRLGQHQPHQR